MDPAPAIGIVFGFGVIITANILEGGNPANMILLPPLLLVFGTTFFITMAVMTIPDVKRSMQAMVAAFTGGVKPSKDVVDNVVKLADKARREGLLALEDGLKSVDDEFLVKGVTMAIDGTDPEEVREILEAEVTAKRSTTKQAAKFFSDMGAYAPTVGIVGTVMGLVHVLENLDKPETLGHSIAAAFLATLWGVASANVMWLPIASRIKRLGELECSRMELTIEGVAAIQAGSNPRVVAQKLKSLLPPGEATDEAA